MAPTNKKAKSSTKKASASTNSTAATSDSTAASAPPPPTEPFFRPFLTSGQLTIIIFISIALSYILDYYKAMTNSDSSNTCQSYIRIATGTACSPLDERMIRAKYVSSIATTALVGAAAWISRHEEPLLLRLISALLLTPIVTTVMALQACRLWITPNKNFAIGIMCTVLLIVGMGAFGNTPILAQWQSPATTMMNLTALTIASLILVHGYDLLKLGMEQTDGYVMDDAYGEDGAVVTLPAKALIFFIMVDKTTNLAMLFVSLAFFNDFKRRSFLFYFAMIHAAMRYYFYPTFLMNVILDAEYQKQFYFGSAMFAMTASMAPAVTFFTSDAISATDEDQKEK